MNILGSEQEFLKKHHIDEMEYSRTGLNWEQLHNIFETYLTEIPQYRALEHYFSDCLGSVVNVHSVITRLKDPESLIATLISKKISNNELSINNINYHEIVPDLMEIKVLYLFKEDWEPVHEYITHKWALRAKPTAYVRDEDDLQPDRRELLVRYRSKGCDIQLQDHGYRMLAYLAPSGFDDKTSVSILSRTIFEEGWGAVDQAIRDLQEPDNPVLRQYLLHFGRTADMAEDMSSFLYKYLSAEQEQYKQDGQVNDTQSQPHRFEDLLYMAGADKPSSEQRHETESAAAAAQDEHPGFHPGIPIAQRNEHSKEHQNEQETVQMSTLSKLKQAIQAITPKNPYQNPQETGQPDNSTSASNS